LVTTHSEVLLNAAGIGVDEVHRLVPTKDGTTVVTAADDPEVRAMVENGLAIGGALMPKVRPENIEQLSLFDVAG
jgi:hypothetical protein